MIISFSQILIKTKHRYTEKRTAEKKTHNISVYFAFCMNASLIVSTSWHTKLCFYVYLVVKTLVFLQFNSFWQVSCILISENRFSRSSVFNSKHKFKLLLQTKLLFDQCDESVAVFTLINSKEFLTNHRRGSEKEFQNAIFIAPSMLHSITTCLSFTNWVMTPGLACTADH